MLKHLILKCIDRLGYQLHRKIPDGPILDTYKIPDANCYVPFFTPWMCDETFNQLYCQVSGTTIVTPDRAYTLWTYVHHTASLQGIYMECGVYNGGTARLVADALELLETKQQLYLFDTFEGMPRTSEFDLHEAGDFKDVTIKAVKQFVGHQDKVIFHKGFIPDTFDEALITSIAFAHIDVDIYDSVLACCKFIYPRLLPGGVMIFDDYGFASCPGARRAVDSFFQDKPEFPLILQTAQAIITKLPT